MPTPILPAAPARRPTPGAEPARIGPKHEPYDTGPWHSGRQEWLRALEADKKR